MVYFRILTVALLYFSVWDSFKGLYHEESNLSWTFEMSDENNVEFRTQNFPPVKGIYVQQAAIWYLKWYLLGDEKWPTQSQRGNKEKAG